MGSRSPTITLTVRIARLRQTVADQLVLGLVTGGFLGPGLIIEKREAQSILFAKAGGVLRRMPDRGELSLSSESSGETVVECRLWCAGMGLRRLIISAAAGALVATLTALAFGWLISWSIPAGFLTALVADLVGRQRDRSQLRHQIKAFIHNTTYLKAI